MNSWKLSPSDMTFLYEECKRCFYLKVRRKIARPRGIMPKIFTKIDLIMKQFFQGKKIDTIIPELPPGRVLFGDKWVQSLPIELSGTNSTCFLTGKFDSVITFDDGSYGVIDFKTSSTKDDHVSKYSRQLHSYAYALENPAQGKPHLSPVTKIGILCVEPCQMDISDKDKMYLYKCETKWIPIKRDDKLFFEFLKEVVTLLEQPEPPLSDSSCEWCNYRKFS